ncbi:hypothetical protein BX600DRAFT_509319 [Xylariales sp. PMI_506]|nr:hypothetical protein BX600DRAFT_509319 [Xylariales sp. PMI_506]
MGAAAEYLLNPPEGVDLNASRVVSNNTIGIILFILSVIFVGLRLLTRVRYQRVVLGLDDYLMCLGLALNAGNLACCIAGGYWGLGRHIWALNAYDMRQISIITFAYVFIYAWSVCIIKFSILAFYRRIFGMTWLGWWCVFLTLGYLITNLITLPLYCKPLSFYWNQYYASVQGVVQVNEAKFYLGIGIINLFGDICILTIPIAEVAKLQMRKVEKVAVCFMFLLGSFVCFASLYRIITIVKLTETTDISWAKSDVFIWSSVEPSVAIISGSLPTMQSLAIHVLAKLGVDTSRFISGRPPRAAPRQQQQDDRGDSVNPLETISKKRTRTIKSKWGMSILESTQFSRLEGEENHNYPISPGRDLPQTWRVDDEAGLTSTAAYSHGQPGAASTTSASITSSDGGIMVKKEFQINDAQKDSRNE